MGFKPFKWIKKHPWESAAILALAGTGLGAAAGAGAAGAAGAGSAAGIAGGTLGLEFGGMTAAQALASGIGGAEGATAGLGSLMGAGGDFVGSDWASGLASAAKSNTGLSSWMTPEKAMRLAQFSGLGQQQPQQRPLGGPVDAGNPWQRPAMATQEQITKKWLMQNAPATYARLYGQQGVA